MRSQRGFTRASALGPIADFVGEQGGSIARVFERADLPLAILDNPDLPLPLPEQFKILDEAAREIGCGLAGARLGQLVRIEQLSAFGRWVSDALTVGGAINRSNKGLNRFLQTGTVLALKTGDERVSWSIEFLDPGFNGRFQNELLGVSYLVDVVRSYLGRSWCPDLIRVTGTEPRQAEALETIFGTAVSAGHRVSSIEFDAGLLAACRSSATRRPSRTATLGADILHEQTVPGSAEHVDAVAAMIALAMLEGYPKIDWIASKLGLTRRTLQRQLATNGVTFSALLEDLMRDRAMGLLGATERPVTEIAYRLGYSDPAHFTRAFRRWADTTPENFRKKALGAGAANGRTAR
ncbi:MAG: AraC family transcriptional regulator ligand-binding domain-containing protein [Pseudomonadota bacterium]